MSLPLLAAATVGMLAIGCQTPQKAALKTAPTKEVQSSLTPAAAYQRLKDGNARFVAGQSISRNWSKLRADTAGGQYPFAVVLSCLDSRTSSEIVFDQGIGDIFNARVAGNVLNDDILGSMEFACGAAGAKVIAVIGHSSCGAVKGACSGVELGHLTGLLDRIEPAVKTVGRGKKVDVKADPGVVDAVASENVRLVMRQVTARSPLLRDLVKQGKVKVVGGMHDLASGKVTFFE